MIVLRDGGKIQFDDPEGAAYDAVILELAPPRAFAFREVDDLIATSLENVDRGCRMIFMHRFADKDWAVKYATGWHGWLEVVAQLVNSEPIRWMMMSANCVILIVMRLTSE